MNPNPRQSQGHIPVMKTLLARLGQSRFRNLQNFWLWNLTSGKILLVESPESWALESAISLMIGIQSPRSFTWNSESRTLAWGIAEHYEPVTCTRGCSYLFLLLIELSCCKYLETLRCTTSGICWTQCMFQGLVIEMLDTALSTG